MDLIQELHICRRNDVCYIFHGPSLQIYSVNDPDFANNVQYAKSGKSADNNIYQMLYQLQEAIDSASPTIKTKVCTDESINSYVLPISGDCNLRCPYCFARQNGNFGFSSYSESDMKRVIDYLYLENKHKKTQVSFFGGEPFLNYDIIEFAVNYSHTIYPEWEVSFSVTTNGTIYSEKIASFLEKNNISLLISIDGPKSENNLRRYPNGRQSVDRVIHNIKKYSNGKINIQLRATLTNQCLDIISIYDFFEQIGLPFSIVFAYKSANKDHCYSNYDESTISNIKIQLDNLIDYYVEKIQKNEPIKCISILNRLQQLEDRVIKPISCSGGRNMFSITNTGDIYSCEHFVHSAQYAIGNIQSGINIEKISQMQAIPVDDIPSCKNCVIKNLCNGGCFSEKVLCNLKIEDKLLESECRLILAQWEFIIKLFGVIKHIKPDFLKPSFYEKS